MKTYICLFFLLFCSVYSWGQSLEERMATAIDIGTYSEPFTYEVPKVQLILTVDLYLRPIWMIRGCLYPRIFFTN